MQCDKCKAQNKKGTQYCKRCGRALKAAISQPSWRWSFKILVLTYAVLTAGYFLLRMLL